MQRTPTLLLLLLFAAVSALAAVGLAHSELNRGAFGVINAAAARWLPPFVPSGLTILGHGLVAVMLLAPLVRPAPQVLAAALCAAPLAGVFSALGKHLAATARPAAVLDPGSFFVQGQVLAGHNAFPSGHSITIFLLATVLILGVAPLRAHAVRSLGVLLVALAAAASRVMVGAHWPSDVLGGAALGTLAGIGGSWMAARWPLWRHARARPLLALVVLACALALALADTGYPLARPLQWLLAATGALFALRALWQGPAASHGAAAP